MCNFGVEDEEFRILTMNGMRQGAIQAVAEVFATQGRV